MFEFFRSLVPIVAPIFVVSTMLNVGLTQTLSDITGHLKNYPFVLKVLIANFVIAPLLMIAALYFARFDPALKAGMLIFSLCAGAPFLIKLTQTAKHDLSLGGGGDDASDGGDGGLYADCATAGVVRHQRGRLGGCQSLFLQLLLPIAAGMLVAQFLPDFARTVQPWVGWAGNIALYVLVGATLIGYFPNMIAIVGTGAILGGLTFVAAAFGIGYLAGAGKDHLEDVGGLGTAQRNTAAGVIIATQNFSDHANVLVMITLANTLGIVMLLLIARALSRDNLRGNQSEMYFRPALLQEIAPRKYDLRRSGQSQEEEAKRRRT